MTAISLWQNFGTVVAAAAAVQTKCKKEVINMHLSPVGDVYLRMHFDHHHKRELGWMGFWSIMEFGMWNALCKAH